MKAVEKSEQENRVPAGPKSLPGPKKRVLLAKQESPGRYELLQHLNKAAFEVELASNGEIALRKLGEVHLDAIVVDAILPDVKGEDLLKQIRQMKGFEAIPVFVCGGGGSIDSWQARKGKSEATRFFSKSATPAEEIVADVVAHVGVGNRKLIQTTQAAKTVTTGAKSSKRNSQEAMSDEIRKFEIAWQKPGPGKPVGAASPVVSVNDAASPEAQLTYWQNKLQELTLENVKLQARVADAEQVTQAKAAAEKAEAAYQAEAARAKKFFEELGQTRQARDGLNTRLAAEARQLVESKQRNELLTQQLTKNSAELARMKTELERQVAERGPAVSVLSEQVTAAKAAAEKAEAARKEEAARGSRAEAELMKHVSERGSVESQLREELQEAKVSVERLRAACREQTTLFTNSKDELTALQRARDEFNVRLANGQQAAAESRRQSEELERRLATSAAELQRVKAELEKQVAERGSIETQLREQLQANKAANEKLHAAHREQTSISTSSKEELAALQRARDELNARLANEQQTAAETKRQRERLEGQLRETGIELARLKVELESRVTKHGSAESELGEQLAAAKAAAKKAEAARNEEAEKGRRVEVELGRLKQASAELSGKLTEAEQLAVRSRQRGEEVERRLAESAAELQRVKAELQGKTVERSAAESRLREELQTAKATAEKAEASSREQLSGFARAKEELAALQRARDGLNARVAAEQQAAAESRHRSEELGQRLAEGAKEVQRVKAELEKQAAERGSAERELREQLQTAKAVAERAGQSEELEDRLRESATKLEELKAESDKRLAESASVESRLAKQLEAAHAAAARAQAAHEKEAERGSRVEDELASLRVARTTLKGQLLDEKMAAAKAQRHVKQLEERVSRSAADLKLAKANPARKAIRRTGRGTSGVAQPADLSRMDLRVRDGISALARATADLEKERRRLESAVLPSDNLMQSIRRLLELPLDAQQKKLVESTLESALQVQASLH